MPNQKPSKTNQRHPKPKTQQGHPPSNNQSVRADAPAFDGLQRPNAEQDNKPQPRQDAYTSQSQYETAQPARRIDKINIVLSLIFSGVVAFFTIISAVYSHKQWVSVQDALTDAKKTREIENAAYVGMKGAVLDQPLHIGEGQIITVTLMNAGNTPALDLTTSTSWTISPTEPVELPLRSQDRPPQRDVIQPGADFVAMYSIPNIDERQFNAINGFKEFIFVWGKVEYKDIFGKPRWYTFCLMHRPTTQSLKSCSHGNSADRQYAE